MRRVRFQKIQYLDYEVIEYEEFFELDSLVVDKEHRNQGMGSEFMIELIKYADDRNKLITLSSLGENQIKLENFYRKFGFKNIIGTNKLKFKGYNMYKP
jgi:GNAT superfamily N-acetyltransferase